MSRKCKIIQKQRKECASLGVLLVDALQCADGKKSIEKLQFAKLLIETVSIKQACERRAWGLDDGKTLERPLA